jgi:hypothetical protein
MTRMTMPILTAALLLGGLSATHAAAAAAGTRGITEAQARNEISLDGYRDVRDLHKVADGWMASAKEGDKSVSVIADNNGDVRKQ